MSQYQKTDENYKVIIHEPSELDEWSVITLEENNQSLNSETMWLIKSLDGEILCILDPNMLENFLENPNIEGIKETGFFIVSTEI